MKSTSTLIVAIITMLLHLSSSAQNATEKKILGCWQLNKMEFIVSNENAAQLDDEAKNAVICFDQNGKFTTRKNSNISNALKGVYHISTDEKTIYQTSGINQGIDEPAQIILLNEKELIIKTEHATLYLKRENENAIKSDNVLLETKAYQLDEVKVIKRTHKNEQKSKRLRSGMYYATNFDTKIAQSAKFFANEFSTPKYLKKVKFKTRSSENNRVLNLLFYSVGENGEPKDLLYEENLICNIKKGTNVNTIDVDELNIEFPKNGIFVVIEKMLVEQNKYFVNKNPLGFLYEPFISANKIDEYSDTWYLLNSNEWKKNIHFSLNMQIVTSE